MPDYKYLINHFLMDLPKKDYNTALKVIPGALGISVNTFLNYRNIRLTDERDIPHQKIIMLEKIFGLDAGGLNNFRIEMRNISELLAKHASHPAIDNQVI